MHGSPNDLFLCSPTYIERINSPLTTPTPTKKQLEVNNSKVYHRRITSLITFCTSYSRHPWPLDESFQINVSNVYLFTFFFFCKLRNIHLLVSHQPTVTTHACKDRFSFGDVIVAYKNIKLLMCTFIVIFSPSSVYNLDKLTWIVHNVLRPSKQEWFWNNMWESHMWGAYEVCWTKRVTHTFHELSIFYVLLN